MCIWIKNPSCFPLGVTQRPVFPLNSTVSHDRGEWRLNVVLCLVDVVCWHVTHVVCNMSTWGLLEKEKAELVFSERPAPFMKCVCVCVSHIDHVIITVCVCDAPHTLFSIPCLYLPSPMTLSCIWVNAELPFKSYFLLFVWGVFFFFFFFCGVRLDGVS